ncbi:flagellar motor switch protein FliN [Sphingomonas sp. CFBP9019]|uniref:flagellar motor switch protein FliN n=1 Tax=Sphingomonas sp. CFBP9019 TaxID=3096532 RepID=UPI0039C983EE
MQLPGAPAAAATPSASASADEPELHAVFDVPVRVQAVLGRSRIPIGELLRLKVGMVIELDRKVGEPVDIFVNDRLIARGEVVLIDDSLGITLTEIVRQDR